MQIDQNLIDKFFAGKCSKEEAIAVSHFLKDPENFNTHWDEREWKKMEPNLEFDNSISEQMNVKILDSILNRQARKDTRIRVFSYAASFLLIVSSVFLYYYPTHQASDKIDLNHIALEEQNKPVILKNESSRTKTYHLPDGSIVEVEVNSEISYLPFNGNKREIFLKGEALFRVHKDKKRPFTVYASDLATTALGTIFRIYARQESLLTKVNLIEGKVVVRPQNKFLKAGIRSVYLTPGKSFSVNKESYAASVSNFIHQDKIKGFDLARTGGSTTINSDAIVFNNQSLATVFDVLSKELNIKIDYRKTSIRKKVFSGQYEFGRDDAAAFLNMVCSLNNLKVSKTNLGYTIKYELKE